MKRTVAILFLVASIFTMLSCGGSAEKQAKETKDSAKIETIAEGDVVIYYFHSKQRCRTCIGIQNVAQEAFSEAFADNNKVKFVELDFTERSNAELANRYEIAFSSLVVATSTEHTNLTDFAFANVNSNPDALKDALVEEVKKYLSK